MSIRTILVIICLIGLFSTSVPTLMAKTTTKEATSSSTLKLKVKPVARPKIKLNMKIETTVKAKYMFGAVGDTVTLKAFLYVAGKSKTPVVGKKLTFYVGGTKIGASKTDSKGCARIKYKVPNEIAQKKTLVKFYGEGRYQPSSDTNKFASINSSTKMTAENAAAKPGQNAYIKGTLTRITDDSGVNGRKIIAELGGQVVAQAATVNGGKFEIKYVVPSSAKQPIRLKIRFNGDKMYLANSADVTIDVHGPKPKAYLMWNGATGVVGQTVTITAKLGRKRLFGISDGIAGKKIRVWRERNERCAAPRYKPKNICKGVTNKDGIAKMTYVIDDDAQRYLLGAHLDQSFPYDYELVKCSDPRLIVSKSPVTVTVTCGLNKAKIGSKLMFLVKLTRNLDGMPLANEYIHFHGQKKKTSSLGTIAFFHTIKNTGSIGPRAFTAVFNEDKKYFKGEGSFTIDVQPLTN